MFRVNVFCRFASLRGGTTKQSSVKAFCLDCFVPRNDGKRHVLLPILIRILHQHGVEVLGVAGNLFAEPGRLVEGLVLVGELDFSHDESVVVAIKLVDFPGVLAVGVLDEIAGLVDDTRLADFKQALPACTVPWPGAWVEF